MMPELSHRRTPGAENVGAPRKSGKPVQQAAVGWASEPNYYLTKAFSGRSDPLSAVIAGLDPAIHLSSLEFCEEATMDPRVKPAGDD
jgi:hypothetical protein